MNDCVLCSYMTACSYMPKPLICLKVTCVECYRCFHSGPAAKPVIPLSPFHSTTHSLSLSFPLSPSTSCHPSFWNRAQSLSRIIPLFQSPISALLSCCISSIRLLTQLSPFTHLPMEKTFKILHMQVQLHVMFSVICQIELLD